MRAYCLIREQPVYRRGAFVKGLRAAGYDVLLRPPPLRIEEGDVLLIWNRYGANHEAALRVAEQEGVVLVAENAYVGNDREKRTLFALARDGHNGRGAWPFGGAERWLALGLSIAPWREDGEHVLICPNRSFGTPGGIMPLCWAEDVAKRLRKVTQRPVRIRPHPGNDPPRKPLVEDLAGAWAVVIWSSSAGCEALLRGIPVLCEAPYWICKSATQSSLARVEDRFPEDKRTAAFERLAWAQWSVKEIESGEPFSHLLKRASAFAGGL